MNDALWQEIRAEVEEAASREPALASYLHAAVLAHPSLESALAWILAGLLGNEVVPALSLHRVIEEAFAADPQIAACMRRDLLAHYQRDPACDRRSMPLLHFKGFHALEAHRVAHWLWRQGRRGLAFYLQSRISECFAVDIHPAARIGGGLMIDHATGVVIGETAVVGEDVSMLHGVTLGGTGHERGDRHPKIGRGVLISTGAILLGNITVGEGAKIGAGSLVLDSVPPYTTVAGVPARPVGRRLDRMPALEMDHSLNGGEGS
ncbi:MAG: serine O-acetyltransferase [Porticoccaceae bacterium]|nr:MAG: serine O-acetyltransferase [Porticoccaceae bacterium]